MTLVRFDEVSLKVRTRGKCTTCGRSFSRTHKLWQTLNPFNRTAGGLPKTRDDIMAELVAEREQLLKKPLTCQLCLLDLAKRSPARGQ